MEGQQPEPTPPLVDTCSQCGAAWKASARFCIACGKPKVVAVPLEHRSFEREQRDLFIVFGVVLAYILGSYLIDRENHRQELLWDLGFFLLVCGTGWWLRALLAPVIRPSSIKVTRLAFYLGLQVLMTAAVVILTNAMNKAMGLEASDGLWTYRDAPFPLAAAILSIGVAPALTEEIAFRGLLFGKLIKLTTPGSAIIVSGFLFALVHFTFISFFWLIPAGLFFGWMRAREGTIWYGILCHFLHNTAVTVGEYHGWW